MRRAALEAEASVISLLAKLDSKQLAFMDGPEARGSNGAAVEGQIQIVVAEGLQITVPLAGTPSLVLTIDESIILHLWHPVQFVSPPSL